MQIKQELTEEEIKHLMEVTAEKPIIEKAQDGDPKAFYNVKFKPSK